MLGRVDLYTSKFSHFALQQAKPTLPPQRAFHIRPAAITVLSRLAYLQAKSALLPTPKPSPQKALPPNKNANASQHSGTRKDLTGSNLWPVRSAVYRCYLSAPTSRLEPPPSGAESGCVREAVWKPHCGTERPVRLQFMAGRVGLYRDVIYTHKRPDSSRPQAARSRVACAKRRGSRTAAGRAGRAV